MQKRKNMFVEVDIFFLHVFNFVSNMYIIFFIDIRAWF